MKKFQSVLVWKVDGSEVTDPELVSLGERVVELRPYFYSRFGFALAGELSPRIISEAIGGGAAGTNRIRGQEHIGIP